MREGGRRGWAAAAAVQQQVPGGSDRLASERMHSRHGVSKCGVALAHSASGRCAALIVGRADVAFSGS